MSHMKSWFDTNPTNEVRNKTDTVEVLHMLASDNTD